jgi:hypothetical protein
MCDALDTDYVNPGNVAGANCDGDTQPPGLCTVPDCCVSYVDNGFVIETNCQYLASPILFASVGGFCGRKIVDYECDHVRTDYSAGAFCLSLPTVTLELV